ncbi:O-methyltransferase [Leifsonia sp. McL0607]|uniref:O-methyltransferase n=1 Tax=Leifsonia sp. McL0607 TaxID=3415672 RepID=UPI003CF5B85E
MMWTSAVPQRDQTRTALHEWAIDRFVDVPADVQHTERNNATYLDAFLRANDDVFDAGFRAELRRRRQLDGHDRTFDDANRMERLESALEALAAEERSRLYGDGVAPAGLEAASAYVAVQKMLSHAADPARRLAVFASWQECLDPASDALSAVEQELIEQRAHAQLVPELAGDKRDYSPSAFTDALLQAWLITAWEGGIADILEAVEWAMAEAPRAILDATEGHPEPVLDVSRVLDTICHWISEATGGFARLRSRTGLAAIIEFETGSGVSGAIQVWLVSRSGSASGGKTSSVHASEVTEPLSFGTPIAHVALRCDPLDDGACVMHLRDLRSTLHEVGHGVNHAYVAGERRLETGLDYAGEREIDLLSTWFEWGVFLDDWQHCLVDVGAETTSVEHRAALCAWQRVLRTETYFDLPVRLLTARLDREWRSGGSLESAWQSLVGRSPADSQAVYRNCLSRLAWPIPIANPGGEYGLYWAMAEVAGEWNRMQGRSMAAKSLPAAFTGRRVGSPMPAPRELIEFFGATRHAAEAPVQGDSDAVGAHTPFSSADFIAAMLPPRSAELTTVLREALRDHGLPPIHVDDNAAAVLQCLTLVVRPRIAVEIGTLFGYSTIHIARGLPAGSHLISYEVDQETAEIARRNVTELGLADRVTIVTGDAISALAELAPGSVDLAFIDGAKAEYASYVKAVFPLLADGGILLLDDAFAAGDYSTHENSSEEESARVIRSCIRALARSPRLTSSFLGTENGIFMAVKGPVND